MGRGSGGGRPAGGGPALTPGAPTAPAPAAAMAVSQSRREMGSGMRSGIASEESVQNSRGARGPPGGGVELLAPRRQLPAEMRPPVVAAHEHFCDAAELAHPWPQGLTSPRPAFRP